MYNNDEECVNLGEGVMASVYTAGVNHTEDDTDILEAVERYASTPRDGRYPTDAQCERYEARLRARRGR